MLEHCKVTRNQQGKITEVSFKKDNGASGYLLGTTTEEQLEEFVGNESPAPTDDPWTAKNQEGLVTQARPEEAPLPLPMLYDDGPLAATAADDGPLLLPTLNYGESNDVADSGVTGAAGVETPLPLPSLSY